MKQKKVVVLRPALTVGRHRSAYSQTCALGVAAAQVSEYRDLWHPKSRCRMLMLAILVCCLSLFPLSMARAQEAQPAPSASLLAQRLVELSRSTLQSKEIDHNDWRSAVALLQSACRLDPQNARYARLLVDGELRLQDFDAAAKALLAYRTLRPDDRVAQVQLIDLYAGRIETADAKLKYLNVLLKTDSLPATVRSHVAVLAARVQYDALRMEQAGALVAQALELNPLNMDALRMRYDAQASAASGDRIATLAAMLKSNPTQLWAAQALAGELATAGLPDLANTWYRRSTDLAARVHRPLSPAFGAEYAAELYISNQPELADSVVVNLLQADPNNMNGLYIGMLSARQSGNQTKLKTYRDQAINVALNRLAEAYAQATHTQATTRPVDTAVVKEPIGDRTKQAEAMKKDAVPGEARDSYISALGDLAWIELYFNEDAASAGHAIDALKILLPQSSVTLTRLQGWRLLVEKKTEEAGKILQKSAEKDPLSALGLIRLRASQNKTKDQVKQDAADLLNAHPAGLVGAVVWSGVRDLGVKLTPPAESTDPVRRQMEAFPRNWLDILTQPRLFYSVQFEPRRIAHHYAEPMLARVTVRNVGDQPLTVGPEGIIRRDLWIEARLRGLHQQAFPAVAFDQLGDRLVLQPGESISREVRVDQGSLDDFLKSDPAEPIQVSAGVILNPLLANDTAVPGPAGQRAQLSRLFQRDGFAMNGPTDQERLYALVRHGTPAERIRGSTLLAVYIQMFRSDKANDDMKKTVGDMMDVLRKTGDDDDAGVAAWANYLYARLLDAEARRPQIQAMAGDSDWTQRLLALVAARTLPPDQQQALAGPLKSDADADVAAYARTVAEAAATTRPTSQP